MVEKLSDVPRTFGTTISVKTERTFGFIEADDSTNTFFSFRELVGGKIPKVGQRVSFIAAYNERGQIALNIVAELGESKQ
jgi:cold shock CspA family protein